MERAVYWKNFKLGKELDVAGRFIYNGLQCFHQMKTFYYEEEIFEFFYNLSVGLERLLKIAVILIEHDDKIDQKKFKKSLITHSHSKLLNRIKGKHNVSFGRIHNEFIQILEEFYKTHRYGRYDIEAMSADGKEKRALHSFFKKHLKIEIDDEAFFKITGNDDKIKKSIGTLIGKISNELYKIIMHEAVQLNIYTYEIRCESKASKIFLLKENTFSNEDALWKELLIFFMNTKEKNGYIDFIKQIEPLEFDPALVSGYLECFKNDEQKLSSMGEMESLHAEEVDAKDRLELLSIIGDPTVCFDDGNDDTED